jgi:hypothetical protein
MSSVPSLCARSVASCADVSVLLYQAFSCNRDGVLRIGLTDLLHQGYIIFAERRLVGSMFRLYGAM